MEKQTLYLIIVIIIAIVILAAFGEYFAYKYYALLATQQQTNQNQNQPVNPPAKEQAQTKSSAKSITSFSFDNPASIGDIDQIDYTVNITVPAGTDITKLKPNIYISDKATIVPASGTAQNFSKPIAYLVTAEDGSTRTYIAELTMVKSSQKAITSFQLKSFYPVIQGDVNETHHTVYAVVPDGTDLSRLLPTITVSNNATINPPSGVRENFNIPLIYTVKAQDGSTQDYTIMVVTESNSG